MLELSMYVSGVDRATTRMRKKFCRNCKSVFVAVGGQERFTPTAGVGKGSIRRMCSVVSGALHSHLPERDESPRGNTAWAIA
jgi:hypothetical protein